MDKLVIFDLDGTLINTLDDLAYAANETLRRFDLPTHPVEAYKQFVGRGRTNLIRSCSGLQDEDRIAELCRVNDEIYSACCLDRTRPYDGIHEAIDQLRIAGIGMAVLSNKNHDQTCRICKALFPDDPFHLVLGKRPGYPLKPDPASVFEILITLDMAPERTLAFGDSGSDMKTALAAGIYPIGVTWGFRELSELQEAGAKKIISRPIDIFPATFCFNRLYG